MGRETWKDMVADAELALVELRRWVISAWQSLRDAFLVPGEYAVTTFSEHMPEVAGKLAFAAHGETYAVVFSVAVWLCLGLAVTVGLRSAYRALTGYFRRARRGAASLARLPRSLRVQLAAPVETIRRRRAAGRCYSEEFSISKLQMAVMIVQRKLPPGHVATAVDIAGELGVRPGPVERALETLRKLHLVQVAFATSDGYPGYSLTRPGEIFLSTCAASARRRVRQPLRTS
jgi:DNA-binding MarR family transcriptional regulator